MKTFRTPSFRADFKELSESLKRRAEKALRFLIANYRHPSLRAKKIEAQRDREGRDIWEARVTKRYRFTFVIAGDAYILYRIGPHDIERRPR